MDITSPELENALIKCANTFDLSGPVKDFKDLRDGHLLWEMLQHLDSDHFTNVLPENRHKTDQSWISRWHNMMFIHMAMITYLNEVATDEGLIRLMDVDLKSIAINGDVLHITRMLKGLLMLGFSSEEANPVLRIVVRKMDSPDQNQIATMAQTIHLAMERAIEPSSLVKMADEENDSDVDKGPQTFMRDPELEHEERLISANQKNIHLYSKLLEATGDLDNERKKTARLTEELIEARVLEEKKDRRADDDVVYELRLQVEKDCDRIAQLETNLEEAEKLNHSHERRIQRFTADAEDKQALHDEIRMLNVQLNEHKQKTKGMENLRKKVESLQEQVKAQQRLHQRIQSMTEDLQELDQLRKMNCHLKTMNEETIRTLATTEADLFQAKKDKALLEQELKGAVARADSATAMFNRYQTENQQLEERLLELEDRSTGIDYIGSLADQLKDEDGMDAKLMTRKSVLANNDNSDVELLRQKIELLTSRCERVEEKYLDVFQENLGLQAAIQENPPLKERDDPFLHQTIKLRTAEANVKELTNKTYELTAKNIELQAKLVNLTSTGEITGVASADYLTMKESYEKLLAAYETLHKNTRNLDNEIVDWRALLRHKLLNADINPLKDVEELQANELKLLQAQLTIYRDAADDDDADRIKIAIASDVARKLFSLSVCDQDRHIEDLQSTIKALKAGLEHTNKGADHTSSQDDLQNELHALQRENKLIMSAWYDMANRLQSNTVVLQRTKIETPKSWLVRQRVDVSRGIAVGLSGISASVIGPFIYGGYGA